MSNTATALTSGQPDPNPADNSSTATITVPPGTDIPTLDDKPLLPLAAIMATFGAFVIGKK